VDARHIRETGDAGEDATHGGSVRRRRARTLAWTTGVLLGAMAASAAAQNLATEPAQGEHASATPYARDGAYLALGGHAAIENFDPPSPASRPTERWSGGLSARAGIRTHPHMAGELVFDWVSPWSTEGGDLTSYLITGNVKFNFLTGRIQPYAILGIGVYILVQDFDTGGSSTSVPPGGRFGAGIDYYIDEHVVVNFEGVYVPPLDSRADDFPYALLQGNLMYRF
jgi:hypothetical protein